MTLKNPMIEFEASIDPVDRGGYAIVRSDGTQRSIRLDSLADFLFLREACKWSYQKGRGDAVRELENQILVVLDAFD